MPIQEDSKIKESQNEEHLDGSENTKEQNVPKIGKGIINGKYLGGYLALLAIVIAAAQNVFGTDAFTRSACWFCFTLHNNLLSHTKNYIPVILYFPKFY